MANSVKIIRKKGTTIYCKTRDQKDAIGVEIAEAMKPKDDPKSYIQAEGRVALRFFNTGMPKETHIRMMLESWEAFDLYLKIQEVIRAKEKVELKITHRYMRGSKELLTSVIVEHWVGKEKSGFAIKASRKGGASHNVSMDRTHILYAGEILKGLSTAQAWSDVEVWTE